MLSITSYANIVPNFKKEYKNSIKKIKWQCFEGQTCATNGKVVCLSNSPPSGRRRVKVCRCPYARWSV